MGIKTFWQGREGYLFYRIRVLSRSAQRRQVRYYGSSLKGINQKFYGSRPIYFQKPKMHREFKMA